MKQEKINLISIPLINENNKTPYFFNLSILKDYKKAFNEDYQYYINNEVIDINSNYSKWLYLQALNALSKIYLEQSADDTIVDIYMSDDFFQALIMIINNPDVSINMDFDDPKIFALIPSLCGYIAFTYQEMSEDQVKKLIYQITNNINKNIYQVFDKIPLIKTIKYNTSILKSHIPFIEIDNNCIGIEFLDEQKEIGSLVNIYIGNNDKIIKYLNVFIKLDPQYILDNKTKLGKLYRIGVGKILLDKGRAKRIIIKRSGYFGIIKIDQDNYQINKLIEADSLYESNYIQKIEQYKKDHNIVSSIN
ncbi:MAG: hypothetical protein GX861_04215 [Tenericutes bacterium]|nr:hypothetical protein [Mycoplasmatota bacterium]